MDHCFLSDVEIIYGAAHLNNGVNLLLQESDLNEVLPDCLLQVQDAAALLLRVTGDFQLKTHTLLFLTVFLRTGQKKPRINQQR